MHQALAVVMPCGVNLFEYLLQYSVSCTVGSLYLLDLIFIL